MNIGVISYILNPKSGSRAPIDLAMSLKRQGHDVSFYAFSQNKDSQTLRRFRSKGIKTFVFEKSKIPFLNSFMDFFYFYRLVKKGDHQVINTHVPLPLFFSAWVTRVPVVLSYHGTQFNVLNERFLKENILINFLNQILNTVIYIKTLIPIKLASEVVAISRYTKNEVKVLFKRKVHHVHSGNAPQFFLNEVGKKKGSTDSYIKILSVSRITPYKQFEKIIDAFNKLTEKSKNLELTIVGSSPQPKYLDYLKSIKRPNVKILVGVSDKHLISLYKKCDIYTTADKYLFFGMPILEAASFGIPTVAFDYCAARELITHGETGYVARNSLEFEKYLRKMIEDSKLRAKMGRAAKSRSDEFSWEKTANGYEKVFRKVLNK